MRNNDLRQLSHHEYKLNVNYTYAIPFHFFNTQPLFFIIFLSFIFPYQILALITENCKILIFLLFLKLENVFSLIFDFEMDERFLNSVFMNFESNFDPSEN